MTALIARILTGLGALVLAFFGGRRDGKKDATIEDLRHAEEIHAKAAAARAAGPDPDPAERLRSIGRLRD